MANYMIELTADELQVLRGCCEDMGEQELAKKLTNVSPSLFGWQEPDTREAVASCLSELAGILEHGIAPAARRLYEADTIDSDYEDDITLAAEGLDELASFFTADEETDDED